MHCLGIADLIVSDESSVMFEGLLLDVPSIAVTDWLIPDCSPPRIPSVPYDFVIKTTKNNLTNTVNDVITNLSVYKANIQNAKERHFSYLGISSSKIMNVIQSYIESKPLPVRPLTPLLDLKPVTIGRNMRNLFNACKKVLRKTLRQIVFVKIA
jgi:hypothetical protein